jgi:hypothetical protein
VIIVTPALGWPEPRPHQLITGDRAIRLLDTTSSAALQKAGVKLATISHSSYSKLVDELVPEVFEGLDPDTGKLKVDVLPAHLTEAAIDDVDLRGGDGRIEEIYLPTRLSADAINDALAGLNSTKTEDDPDGTPVILATETGSNDNDNWTVTGVATINEAVMADAHADNMTITLLDVATAEVDTATFVEQSSTPGNPAAGKYKLYYDTNQRPVYRGNAGIERRFATKRIVTSWPVAGESYLGDEAIHSTTGEHRIYLGTTKGWRLASPFVVASPTELADIEDPYTGMTVFAAYGHEQDLVYKSDTFWHGTQSYMVPGPEFTSFTNINDNNFRRASTTVITDPGYPYLIQADLGLRIDVAGQKGSVDVWTSLVDTGTANNLYTFGKWFEVLGTKAVTRANVAPRTAEIQNGSRDVIVDWRVSLNSGRASSSNYYGVNNYLVIPA